MSRVVSVRVRVSEVAEARGVGIRELARLADMRVATVFNIWHNKQSPRLDTLAQIAFALGVPLSDLLGEVEEEAVSVA